MLVLEATRNRQGERDGDYHWCNDGEIAFNLGIDCARLDCGCERGWAGCDSKRSTTTVQVVERPGFTVDELAGKLATSLFDGGWITEPDPGCELVSMLIDEIIESANQFGEGAVLERDGEWIRERDGSPGEVNPLNRLALEQMTEGVLDCQPMDTLSIALSLMDGVGKFIEPLLSTLRDADWPEAQALGCAVDWLSHGKLTIEWQYLPQWLANLDRAAVTEARRCRGNDGDGYLIALQVDGVELGTASCFVKHEGHIDSFFAIPDSIATYTQLMKTLQRSHYKPFRKVATRTARLAIEGARDLPLPADALVPGISWPNNRVLLDFIVDKMEW